MKISKKIVLLLIFTFQLLWAKGFNFDIYSGYKNGCVKENVYSYDTGDKRLLSQLIWDLEIKYLGTNIGYNLKNFALGFGYQAKLNKNSDEMVDTDWLYPEKKDLWSHRSWHKNEIDDFYLYNISIKYKINLLRHLLFYCEAGYRHQKISFSGYDKYFIYSETSYYDEKYFRSKKWKGDGTKGIEYELAYKLPYVGFYFDYSFFNTFSISFGEESSYWGIVATTDRHLHRDLVYEEKYDGIRFFRYFVRFSYTLKMLTTKIEYTWEKQLERKVGECEIYKSGKKISEFHDLNSTQYDFEDLSVILSLKF